MSASPVPDAVRVLSSRRLTGPPTHELAREPIMCHSICKETDFSPQFPDTSGCPLAEGLSPRDRVRERTGAEGSRHQCRTSRNTTRSRATHCSSWDRTCCGWICTPERRGFSRRREITTGGSKSASQPNKLARRCSQAAWRASRSTTDGVDAGGHSSPARRRASASHQALLHLRQRTIVQEPEDVACRGGSIHAKEIAPAHAALELR
jgi:hypothetical protein